ncbi:hypothetical protein SSX86_028960 [Deinandra increscens subsp. villosa]|uniref:Agenet domain-containing protein n=1 Tax=Deinandra increscens subsp. villosa TaxID=3103831 RepID=A0AAP0C937_9ASTR
MPMDYDDNEFNIHNVELAEEGSSTVSPVLRPYDYEDGGDLRFDSLVENEVFLGITGQEDNQWIEEYSRGTSSTPAESRRDNVWSEATSSESVEMLLKSVGQEALVTDLSDEPGSFVTNMDPNLKQDDEDIHPREAMVTNKEEEGALATEELAVSEEPGSLSINMDLNSKQDDESNLALEAMVTNTEEEGAFATKELDVSDEPGSLAIIMDPNLKPDDGDIHAHEEMVTIKEEEGTFATKELVVSDEPSSLAIIMDPNLKQGDGNNHAQEAMVTNKEMEALVIDSSDEPGRLVTNMDPNLKQDDEDNHALEAMVTNKEEEGDLAIEELDVSDEPGRLSINMDHNSKQDDESNHAQEAMVTNKEEGGAFATKELDVIDEPGSLAINMDPNLKQDDRNIHAQEVIVTNKEDEGTFATKELDVSDEPGSLSINMDHNSKQDDESNHAQEAMVTNKEEEGAFAAKELDVSNEPGSLGINMDPNLKQDNGNILAQEEMVTNKKEEGTFATKELDVSDEPGSLTINMDPNLKQDDGNNHAQEAMVTNKEVGALVTEVLYASDDLGELTAYMDPKLKQNDGNNHAQEAMVTNEEVGALVTEELYASDDLGELTRYMDPNLKQNHGNNHAHEAMIISKCQDHFSGSNVSFDCQKVIYTFTKDSQEGAKVSGLELDSDVLANKYDLSVGKEEGATEELEVSDEPGSLAINMDPKLEQDDGNNHAHDEMIVNEPQDNFSGSNASFDCEKVNVTFKKDSQKATVSGLELDSDVLECDLSEEKADGICDDVNHEARNISVDLFENKLQDLSTSKIECVNLDASKECDLKKCLSSNEAECSTKIMDNTIGSHTGVEPCTNRVLNTSNVQSLDKPPFEVDILVDEEKVLAGSCNLLTTTSTEVFHDSKCAITAFPEAHELNNDLMQEDLPLVAVEDDDQIKSENLASLETNVCSPSKMSDVQNGYAEESEKPDDVFDPSEMNEGSSIRDVGTSMANTCSSTELLAGNTDLVATPKAHNGNSNDKDESPAAKIPGSMQQQVNNEIQSPEQDGGTCINHDVTFHKEGNAKLPLDIASLDSQKHVELNSSAEGCEAHGSEADVTILVEPAAAVNSNMVSSSDTLSRVNLNSGNVATGYIDAKPPPILGGMSSVHQDSEENKEGFVSDGTCENESRKVAGSMIDCASLSVVETVASPDSAGEVVHGTSVENMNAIMNELAQEANSDDMGDCSTPSTVDAIPCDSSAKVGDDVEAGDGIQESISGPHVDMSTEQHASTDMVLTSECDDSHMRHEKDSSFSMDKFQSISPLSNTNNSELSQSKRVEPREGAINENASLLEATEDVVLTSEFDDGHMRPEEDSSVSVDNLQSVSPLLNTNAIELSQNTRVKPSEGAINEETSLPEATEEVPGKEHLNSSNSDMKIDRSFTFDVSATAGLGETGNGLQLFPASQACNLSTNMEVPCTDSSSSTLDPRKPNEAPVVTSQTPGSGTIYAGSKERKPRRKSAGKESVKKAKEKTTLQSGRVDKSSPLLVSPQPPTAAVAAGHFIQFQESRHKEECSATKPIPISNLPDLNNATCIFHQPFTNNQQVQLRAQILVYGSLISGTPPEEPHMIAAFGQSDAERKTWEAAWHACLERVHGEKSQANTPAIRQPQSDLKDVGHRSPDLGIKHSSTLSSSNMGTPAAASPLIPIPSPLWNMFTPSCVDFQSRSAAFHKSYTPIHPPTYQTPPNPSWLSQSPFFGQWGVASSPPPSTSRLSALPIIEAVKLTPVKVSGGGPHAYSMPVVDSTVFPSLSTDGKKASCDSKSRKRKKVTASSVLSQVLTPPIAHLVPGARGHNYNCIPFMVENQTESVTAPVTAGVFSTPVTVSTPPAPKSSSPGRFLSFHDHSLGDKKVGNADDILLKKVEEGNMQEADVNATKTWQPSSDSRSIKRTKVTTISAVNQTPVSTPAPPAVTCLPQVHGSEISLLAQNQTVSVPAPVFSTSVPTSAAMSTPASMTSDSSLNGRFFETLYPTASTHGYPRTGYQNMEHALAVQETLSKIRESKLQAESAALLAAAEVSKCQDVWSMLDSQKNFGAVSDPEAKLLSSVVAAASVAKMASAAAKIASNVAEQAKLMADEVFLSSKPENFNHISHPNVINKDTPASILKSVDKTADNHPNSVISAAREAARRRIEAASAASKHAENLDAIVKAAELAAETVSHVGKIVAMHDSSVSRKLAEAGPEGFWKIPQLAYEQHQGGDVTGLHLNNNSGKKNVAGVFIDEIQTLKHGLSPPEHLAHNQMMMGIGDGSITGNEKDTRTSIVPNLSRPSGVSTEANTGSPHTYVVGHNIPKNTTCFWEEHNIKEGCLVEVYKKDGKYKGAWLAANVLSLKDNKALVCYTTIKSSDQGSEKVKEWVAFEVEGSEAVPRIRIAHPLTTMQFEGARKRCRTAVTDYAWSKGDRVDAWMQDCWREGVVMEPNKIDATSLTVQFPAKQGETSVVRSWHVRPTLIWNDRKWIEWNGYSVSQGDTPKEKRMKIGSPVAVNDKMKDKLPMNVESGRHEKQGTLLPLLSLQDSRFNVEATRTIPQMVQSSFHKPPNALGCKNDAMENQVTEAKPRFNSRKPPVPSFRTITSRDSHRTDADSVENSSSRQNQTQVGSSSNKSKDPAKRPTTKTAFTFTSKPKSEHSNRGKVQVAPKIEVKDRSNSQVNEPRRSNRKIQPTSRLLEGLQSSLTIPKIPSVSHSGQRKITPKGNSSNHD